MVVKRRAKEKRESIIKIIKKEKKMFFFLDIFKYPLKNVFIKSFFEIIYIYIYISFNLNYL
jgi:hypothetical protein